MTISTRTLFSLRTLLLLSTLSALLVGITAYRAVTASRYTTLDDFGALPPFTLTDQHGQAFGLNSLRGKVVVANFVYTSCEDTCPMLSSRMRVLQNGLREQALLGGKVQLISVTTDPARDSPEKLRSYAEGLDADPHSWWFLTGPEATIRSLIQEGFKLPVQEMAGAEATPHVHADGKHHLHEYEVLHANQFVLVDQQGHIRTYYDGLSVDPEQIVRDVGRLAD